MQENHIKDGDKCPKCGKVEIYFEGAEEAECPECKELVLNTDPDVTYDEDEGPTA